MTSLQGKKLLIVSSDSSDLEFVKAAKELGAYVVCCDRYSDWNKSPAKLVADDAWDLDYSKTDAVVQKCLSEKIDGVIAGYGEDRVLAACRISNAIGAPFYATEEQIQFTRNKKLFKQECIRCGLRVPRDFSIQFPLADADLSSVKYPVIVKPADNGGRKGISVCNSEEELREAIRAAEEFSTTGEVVVEEYLLGSELCAVYTFSEGEITLSCLNDKYVAQDGSEMAQLCDFVVTPSKHYEKYLKEVDPKIKALLKNIGAKNGVANFQFIAADDGIAAFEMGYRVNGNNDYKVVDKYNHINFMKMLISYSLTGTMGDSIEKDNAAFPEYYCTYVVHLHPGTVSFVDYSKLYEHTKMDDIAIWRKVGDTVLPTGTNAHKSGMIKFTASNYEEILQTIDFIRSNLIIKDVEGRDMCMYRLDTNRLTGE